MPTRYVFGLKGKRDFDRECPQESLKEKVRKLAPFHPDQSKLWEKPMPVFRELQGCLGADQGTLPAFPAFLS